VTILVHGKNAQAKYSDRTTWIWR